MLRDAQGNVLAIYQKKDNNFTWKEQHLYGSSRLGIFAPEVKIQGTYVLDVAALKQSVRSYELTNHLGNVLSTITDKGVITSAQDYFPFGLTLASRSFTEGGSAYRFGFNGKEDDKETGLQDYGMRAYFKQLGRFPTVDPLTKKYPELTPYQFASNTPIQAIDLDGLEMYYAANGDYLGKNGKSTEIRIIGRNDVAERAKNTLVRSDWDHKWLEEYSIKAYVDTDANQLNVLSKWAKQNQTTDVERAMSLFTLKVNNVDGKGQTEVFVEGETVVAPRSSKRHGGGMVQPSESSPKPYISGAKRSTTIHTHPNGGVLDFSNELSGFMSGGDLQWAMSHNVDLYLVPPSGNEMGKFSVDLYMKSVRAWRDETGKTNSYFRDLPDSRLFKSGEDGDPFKREPEAEAAKQKVKFKEPK